MRNFTNFLKDLENVIGNVEITAIKSYRYLTYPVYDTLDKINANPAQCRYNPTCSHYAEEAIKEWGALKGSSMAIKRILRCNPFGGYGDDPVPKKEV
jgi:uncharacterized protein